MTLLSDNDRLPPASTIATIGMFDGVHLGHDTLLTALAHEARQRGLKALVVTFDRHPRAVVTPDPTPPLLQTLTQRLHTLRQRTDIDYLLVLPFTARLAALTAADIIGRLARCYGLAALMMGYNHRLGHDRATFNRLAHQPPNGIRLVKAPEYLGPYAPVSSTIIRSLLAAGRVADAMHSMQRPFELCGTVVAGFHNGTHLSVEVNIFDFDQDIYGQPIALRFIGFLRLEFKMGSVDDLRRQLTLDRQRARHILTDYQPLR